LTNIDKVMFHSEQISGTVIDNQPTYNHDLVMDKLSIVAVPDPDTYAMPVVGLCRNGGHCT